MPISLTSSKYLEIDKDIASWTDFIYNIENSRITLSNYNKHNRIMLFKALIDRGILNPENKIKEIIEREITSDAPLFIAEKKENLENPEEIKSINIQKLKQFLKNPISAKLRYHLNLYDDYEDNRILKDEEPFYSVYPFDYMIITDALSAYIESGVKTRINSYIDNYYKNSKLLGETPGGAFGKIDLEKIKNDITEKIDSNEKGPGLSDFIELTKSRKFFKNITVGDDSIHEPGIKFPSIKIKLNGKKTNIELNGSLPYLWKDTGSGECETLIVTNSKDFRIDHIISPFLFYISAAAGHDTELMDLFGKKSFTIHTLIKGGTKSYTYNINPEQAEDYLNSLIIDYLNEDEFDFLPIEMISKKKMLKLFTELNNPCAEDKISYRNKLALNLREEIENPYSKYDPGGLLELINPDIPENAYDIVLKRYQLLLSPIIEEL